MINPNPYKLRSVLFDEQYLATEIPNLVSTSEWSKCGNISDYCLNKVELSGLLNTLTTTS